MGQAHRSPKNGHTYVDNIRDHALYQLRRRTDALVHLDDSSLRHMLSEAITHAEDMGLVVNAIDKKGEMVRLVDISTTIDSTLSLAEEGAVAVFKRDTFRPKQNSVITVWTHEIVASLTRAEEVREPFNPALKGLEEMKMEKKDQLPLVSPPEEHTYVVLQLGGEQKIMLVGGKATVLQFMAANPGYRLFKEIKTRIKVEVDE